MRRAVAVTSAGGAGIALLVNTSTSEEVYVEVAGRTSDAPIWVHHVVELVSEGGLVLLAATWTGIALVRWRDRRRRLGVAAAGAAVVAAYALSELLKVVHDQPRPCAAVTAVRAVAECPAVGDWSLPSNHATIAAALGTAVVLLAPRLWPAVLAVVLAVGMSRVALGVHYPHDVLGGFSIGLGVVALVGFGARVATRPASPRSARAVVLPSGDLPDAMLGGRSRVDTPSATAR
jgi:undecaprenyl-diphosphatase